MENSIVLERINSKGWTPGKKEVLSLWAILPTLNEDMQDRAHAALTKIEWQAIQKLRMNWESLDLRSKQIGMRGLAVAIFADRSADQSKNFEWVMHTIATETDPRVIKGFAQACRYALDDSGFHGRDAITGCLIELGKKDCIESSAAKAIVTALGKSVDRRSSELIADLTTRFDLDSKKSQLILERDLARSAIQGSEIGITFAQFFDFSKALSSDSNVSSKHTVFWFEFIPGLENLAKRSGVFAFGERAGSGFLSLNVSDLPKNWVRQVSHSRLWKQASLQIDSYKNAKDLNVQSLCQSLVLATDQILAIMGWTQTDRQEFPERVRIRLDHSLGLSRSETWDFASLLNDQSKALICDGRTAHFDFKSVKTADGRVVIVLQPQCLTDDRWAWRTSETAVEGSSHGTLAAAIVNLANISPGERVWDPFCGAGTELIEAFLETANKADGSAQKSGTVGRLYGTDLSKDAIQICGSIAKGFKEGFDFKFEAKDSLTVSEKFDVILTNPPFGMRTSRGEARGILEEMFMRLRSRLTSKGRFVLLSHAPSATADWGRRAGLTLSESIPVMLDQMPCELQRFEV